MAWNKTAEGRRRDAATYQDPEYLRNRPIVMRRANGRCECPGDCGLEHRNPCGRRDLRIQCDHIIPRTRGGGNELANLRGICSGTGSCHAKKTAREGGGYRNPSQADPDPSPRTRWLPPC